MTKFNNIIIKYKQANNSIIAIRGVLGSSLAKVKLARWQKMRQIML